jgi:hypothetical protein
MLQGIYKISNETIQKERSKAIKHGSVIWLVGLTLFVLRIFPSLLESPLNWLLILPVYTGLLVLTYWKGINQLVRKLQRYEVHDYLEYLIVISVDGQVNVAYTDIERLEEDKFGIYLIRKKGFESLHIDSRLTDFTELRRAIIDGTHLVLETRRNGLWTLAKIALFAIPVWLICYPDLWILVLIGLAILVILLYRLRHEVFADSGIPPESKRNIVAVGWALFVILGAIRMCALGYDSLY